MLFDKHRKPFIQILNIMFKKNYLSEFNLENVLISGL